ncbi:MAG: hypothetical protein J5841_03220 [Clostridia bacterium]|nr:hypothetical protein [Clostridia bacterium]
MKNRSRANALLVELLLVIFFFMISAAILVQVFADAKLKSRTAKATNASMLEAQNIAEDLYAAEDPDAVLASYGFAAEDGSWVLEKDGYLLKVTLQEETTETGELRTYEIAGVKDGETLLALPSTRFIPKEVSP